MLAHGKLCGTQLAGPGLTDQFDGDTFDPSHVFGLLDSSGYVLALVGKGGVVMDGVAFFNSYVEFEKPVRDLPVIRAPKDVSLAALSDEDCSNALYLDGRLAKQFGQIIVIDDSLNLPDKVKSAIEQIKFNRLYVAPRSTFFDEPSHESYFEYEDRKLRLADLFESLKSLSVEDVDKVADMLLSNRKELRLPTDTNCTALANLLIERIERIDTAHQFEQFLLQGGLRGLPRTGVVPGKINVTANGDRDRFALSMIAAAAAACAVAGVCSVAAQLAD